MMRTAAALGAALVLLVTLAAFGGVARQPGGEFGAGGIGGAAGGSMDGIDEHGAQRVILITGSTDGLGRGPRCGWRRPVRT